MKKKSQMSGNNISRPKREFASVFVYYRHKFPECKTWNRRDISSAENFKQIKDDYSLFSKKYEGELLVWESQQAEHPPNPTLKQKRKRSGSELVNKKVKRRKKDTQKCEEEK